MAPTAAGEGSERMGAAPSDGRPPGRPPDADAKTEPLPVKSRASAQRAPRTGAKSELTAYARASSYAYLGRGRGAVGAVEGRPVSPRPHSTRT